MRCTLMRDQKCPRSKIILPVTITIYSKEINTGKQKRIKVDELTMEIQVSLNACPLHIKLVDNSFFGWSTVMNRTRESNSGEMVSPSLTPLLKVVPFFWVSDWTQQYPWWKRGERHDARDTWNIDTYQHRPWSRTANCRLEYILATTASGSELKRMFLSLFPSWCRQSWFQLHSHHLFPLFHTRRELSTTRQLLLQSWQINIPLRTVRFVSWMQNQSSCSSQISWNSSKLNRHKTTGNTGVKTAVDTRNLLLEQISYRCSER